MAVISHTRPSVLAAVPTPFAADGTLNVESAADLYASVAASGVDGMFVVGTNGEFPALSLDERRLLVELALEKGSGIAVFPHVGAASSWEAVQLAEHAVESGATRVAAVTPYYYAASNPELEGYYRSVAAAAGGREVYGYSIPSRAGNQIDGELLRRLLAIPSFAGVKVSIPRAETVRELIEVAGERACIYSGSDAVARDALFAGARGIVSGPASAVPGPYVALADAIEAKDHERAQQAQELIDLIARTIGGNIALVKLALEIQGLPGGHTRAPLPRPSREDRLQIERAIETVDRALGVVGASR